MEGHWGLWTLLLWAAIISPAFCQSRIAPTPASSAKEATNANISNSSSTVFPTNFPQIFNEEITPKAIIPTDCSYTVTPIKYGFRFNINRSFSGMYTIILTEDGGPLKKNYNETPVDILKLKPCTAYDHQVQYPASDGNIVTCNFNDGTRKTLTGDMSQDDITLGRCTTGCLSLSTNWNISTSLSLPNHAHLERCDNNLCLRPAYGDICSNLTTTFTCASRNSSFTLTEFISADFLSGFSNVIPQNVSLSPPAEITAELPPQCSNLTVVYSCLDGKISKKVSDLEPFTDYICTGQIWEFDVIKANLTPLSVKIVCDLEIQTVATSNTNTSVVLTWTATSENCSDVISGLNQLTYECTCEPQKKNRNMAFDMASKQNETHGCTVNGLDPYTNYTCVIQPTYRNQFVGQAKKHNFTTAIGVGGQCMLYQTTRFKIDEIKNIDFSAVEVVQIVAFSIDPHSKFQAEEIPTPIIHHATQKSVIVPEDITNLHAVVVNNNIIEVTCVHSNTFNGPKKKLNAILYQDNTVIQRKNKTDSKCKFLFQDLSYSTTYRVEIFASNQDSRSPGRAETVTTHYNDKALTGFLVFLIIFTSVALLVVIYRIYLVKRQRFRDMSENILLIPNATSVEPIEANILLEAYKSKLADEGRLFLAEFQSIPKIFTRYTVREAKKNCNFPKNRYVDILPYDYNRVQLSTGNGTAGCDYINASFIDGYKESKKYIAAQGPKEESVCDFWRMIWEQRSSIIVMVTRCEEGNKNKCVQYWPFSDQETEVFEEFVVKLNAEDHFPDYSIRHLNLNNRKENAERQVTHIQFISWPDHGVPEEPHLLLKLRRRVNSFKNVFSGPIVVHCSAGVGRTGTYIGIDAMMECLEAESKVDIYGYVFKLRKQRCFMVQVEAQYILIHQALLEHNQFGETEISLSDLHSSLSMLKENNSDNEPTLLEDEFDRLPTYKNWKTSNAGITEENKQKNRCSSVIPYDYNRVLLYERSSQDSNHDEGHEEASSDSEDDSESTKYINASSIHGYWGPHSFITAQTPLANTVSDFWLMVYQKKVSTIVMLSGASADEKESAYWEKEKSTFGDIEVEVTSTDASPNTIKRDMLINHIKRKESRVVKHVQFLKWVNRELLENPQDLTDMIKEVKHNCDCGKAQRGPPVVVHCSDGSSRCGVFCALWSLLDSAENEKVVDVFNVSRTLRKERQGMIASLDQYRFLYDALDGVYPVQNGQVKAVRASEADSVQLINETGQETEEKTADVARNTEMGQQEAAESDPVVPQGGQEDKKEAEKLSGSLTETHGVTPEV